MNKKVSLLLEPGVWLYCVILFSFAGISIALKQYYVAGLELAITVQLF